MGRVGADDGRVEGLPVGEDHGDGLRAGYDVVAGDDVTVRGKGLSKNKYLTSL